MDDIVKDSLTSSVVDHVFFIFRKSSERALLTSSLNAICATTNNMITVLNNYKDVRSIFFKICF